VTRALTMHSRRRPGTCCACRVPSLAKPHSARLSANVRRRRHEHHASRNDTPTGEAPTRVANRPRCRTHGQPSPNPTKSPGSSGHHRNNLRWRLLCRRARSCPVRAVEFPGGWGVNVRRRRRRRISQRPNPPDGWGRRKESMAIRNTPILARGSHSDVVGPCYWAIRKRETKTCS